LHLATSLGLDANAVKSERLALPATRFAVGAYLSFCANRTLLEAVASSLTELFSPVIIGERVPAMLAKYDYITEDTLAYFKKRPEQASRDSDFALAYVLHHADTPERQQAVINALVFKCDILWAMLDALQHAYGEAGNIPPGAFGPEEKQ
jgi:pyrroloquinoline-quinone synthase